MGFFIYTSSAAVGEESKSTTCPEYMSTCRRLADGSGQYAPKADEKYIERFTSGIFQIVFGKSICPKRNHLTVVFEEWNYEWEVGRRKRLSE
jgi:hypothetical protein